MFVKHVVALLALLVCARVAPAQDVREMMTDFLAAFSSRDISAFIPYFAENATAFFPPAATAPSTRVQGRQAIKETFTTILARYAQPNSTTRPPIAPQDLQIQEFDGTAIVTFHLGNDAARQRRTFVLRRAGDAWKIVHLHGSAIGAQP
jgi:ketosteroid isomerase-like protein